MIKKILILSALIPCILSGEAAACSCQFGYLHELYDRADSVFTAKVVREDTNKTETGGSEIIQSLDLELEQVFKGPVKSGTLKLTEEESSEACGFDYELNKEYLVFAKWNNSTAQYDTGYCNGTLLKTEEAVAALNEAIKAISTDGTYISSSPFLPHSYEVPLQGGKTNGVVKEFAASGKLVSTQTFVDGTMQGSVTTYDEQGQITGNFLYE